MAARVCPGETQQLHHFISTSRWDTAGHERVLLDKAGALVGGKNAHLIIDDTAICASKMRAVRCDGAGARADMKVWVVMAESC